MHRTYRTILGLLDRRQRWSFALLVTLMLAMAVLNLAGVASVMPFLAVLADPVAATEGTPLGALQARLGFDGTDAFVRFLGAVVFLLVIVSIAVRALTFYAVTRFSRALGMHLAVALLERYLARPYEWFLDQHSADLGKSVLQEVNQVVVGSITPAVRLIANVVVAVFLVGFLVVIEPVGAIAIALLLGLCFGLVYGRLRDRLEAFGQDRRVAVRERYQVTAEALNGIKEVKVLGLEGSYLRRFIGPSRRLVRHQSAVVLIGEMPRYVLEALAFGGILLFVL
jgi:ABC-type multidrug transport system fused ATPase/permease subunit